MIKNQTQEISSFIIREMQTQLKIILTQHNAISVLHDDDDVYTGTKYLMIDSSNSQTDDIATFPRA